MLSGKSEEQQEKQNIRIGGRLEMRRRGTLRVRGEGQGVARAGDEVMEARRAMVVRRAMVARELA